MRILHKPSAGGKRAEKAFQKAVARVMEENRRLGLPVAVMVKGKAVTIPVEQALRAVREERAVYKVKRRKGDAFTKIDR